MDAILFKCMYGYVLEKAAGGEGSRGGKVIGHTPSGKPIYDSQGHTTSGPSGRKPYPGEEKHKLGPVEGQKKKTFLPPEGTEFTRYDSPNLKAYKTLLKQFKRQGVDFMGHISYDPQTDQMVTLSDKGPALVRQVFKTFMESVKKKPEGK